MYIPFSYFKSGAEPGPVPVQVDTLFLDPAFGQGGWGRIQPTSTQYDLNIGCMEFWLRNIQDVIDFGGVFPIFGSNAFTPGRSYLSIDDSGTLIGGVEFGSNRTLLSGFSWGNEWRHIAITPDPGGDTNIYVDAVLQNVVRPAAQGAAVNRFEIGQNQDGQVFGNGGISDFRIWNTLRTASQIEEAYQRRICPAEYSDLQLYLKMDALVGPPAAIIDEITGGSRYLELQQSFSVHQSDLELTLCS